MSSHLAKLKNALIRLSILLTLALNLSSCVSAVSQNQGIQLKELDVGGTPNQKVSQEFSEKDIELALSNKDYKRATVLLSYLPKNGTTASQYRDYQEQISNGFGQEFQRILQSNGLRAALPYYYSMRALNIADRFISPSQFTEKLFDFYVENEYFGAALGLAQASISSAGLDSSLRSKMQAFVRSQYAGESPSLQKLGFWEQRVQGTVTVYVDLGNQNIAYNVFLPAKEIGSGFFIDNNGSIITNYHVISSLVEPGTKVKGQILVKLAGRDLLIPAKLIGWDKERDLALLRISRKTPKLLTLGTSPKMQVGDELFAIGAPGGLESTLTSGRLSATGRKDLLPLSDVLQTDVPANPGNSGGPLLDKNGEVQGVVFAKNNAGYEGIAFAIPNQSLQAVLPRLYQGNEVKNSWLGILVKETLSDEHLLEISYIFPNSPAYLSPLTKGQRIVSFNGKAIGNFHEWQNQVTSLPASSVALIEVENPETGKRSTYAIELGERPSNPMRRSLSQDSTENLFEALYGASLTYSQTSRSYAIDKVQPYSIASQYNLQSGDEAKILKWLVDSNNSVILAVLAVRFQKSFDKNISHTLLLSNLNKSNII